MSTTVLMRMNTFSVRYSILACYPSFTSWTVQPLCTIVLIVFLTRLCRLGHIVSSNRANGSEVLRTMDPHRARASSAYKYKLRRSHFRVCSDHAGIVRHGVGEVVSWTSSCEAILPTPASRVTILYNICLPLYSTDCSCSI